MRKLNLYGPVGNERLRKETTPPALLLLVFLLFFLCSCKKTETADDVPHAIKKEIKQFESSSSCRDAKVDEYLFQEERVYAFDAKTCGADMAMAVLDRKGKVLGYVGGVAGNTTINGQSFSNAVFLRTIWQKTP